MKKFKMIFATLMLGMAIVGGFQAYEYANMTTGSFLLENVEALATTSEAVKITCDMSATVIICKKNSTNLGCSAKYTAIGGYGNGMELKGT